MRKYLPHITMAAAIIVSASAAFYSVYGIGKLFAGEYWNVVIVASSLELSKIILAGYLHEYWSTVNKLLRFYLITAVVALALITSAGIFGFLSNAYEQTATKDRYHTEKTKLLSTKKERFEIQLKDLLEERDVVNSSIQNLSKSLSTDNQYQTIDRKTGQVLTSIQSTKKTGVQNQLNSENERREKLNSRIDNLQDSIQVYEISIIDAQANNDAASELGPLKYLASVTGSEMNEVIKWFILLIMFVFDPLAIALVIAALQAFKINQGNNISQDKENLVQPKLDPLPVNSEDDIEPEIQDTEPIVTIPDITLPEQSKKRGRPRGSKNKSKSVISDTQELSVEELVLPDLTAEETDVRKITTELTPEVAARISDKLPKKKH